MKKVLVMLAVLGTMVSNAYADIIVFDDVHYRLTNVNKPAVSNCSAEFAAALAQDIAQSPVSGYLSADYDTNRAYGHMEFKVLVAHNSLIVVNDTLFPLGLDGSYAFGHWYGDDEQPSITLNQHNYSVYGLLYAAKEDQTPQWLKNGQASIIVFSQSYPQQSCLLSGHAATDARKAEKKL